MEFVILCVLTSAGVVIGGMVYQRLSGKREDGIAYPGTGFPWRPPARQDDEMEKWSKL